MHHVHVSARPPIMYLAGIVIGMGVTHLFSDTLSFSRSTLVIALGAILVLLGFIIAFWAWQTFTVNDVDPNFKAVGTFVESGPYHFSRNPMYVGFTLLYIGTGFLLGNVFVFLLLPLILFYIQKGVIAREEEYLLERFGDRYRAYQKATRRWI